MITAVRVKERGGFATAEDAERAIVATLEALRPRLLPAERALFAAALPEGLARHLRGPVRRGGIRTGAIIQRVAKQEGVRASVAKEHLDVVLSVLADELDAEARQRLERILPPDLAPVPAAPAPA